MNDKGQFMDEKIRFQKSVASAEVHIDMYLNAFEGLDLPKEADDLMNALDSELTAVCKDVEHIFDPAGVDAVLEGAVDDWLKDDRHWREAVTVCCAAMGVVVVAADRDGYPTESAINAVFQRLMNAAVCP